jgi:hypothetical protein
MRNKGIFDSTVKHLPGSTSVRSIGTVMPLGGVIRPRLPTRNGPSRKACFVSGSHVCQFWTSSYIRKIVSGGAAIVIRCSTCIESFQKGGK